MNDPLLIESHSSVPLTWTCRPVVRPAPEGVLLRGISVQLEKPGLALQVSRDRLDLARRIAAWREQVRQAAREEGDWEVTDIEPLRLREPPECD
ncbi:MAG: hypothetical protein HY720_19415 [Planctomycetes bacterium]|nr:hypothetical protein [Planctomycetota bacterium]